MTGHLHENEAILGVLGEQVKRGIYFRGTRPTFEGIRETKTILETRNTFSIFWNSRTSGEQANFFEGNNGTGSPPPPHPLSGRASKLVRNYKFRR